MVSRRNIRVKVMQTLYSLEAISSDIQPREAIEILKKNIEQSKQLFTYLVYFITEISAYAQVDSLQKSSKHLPTYNDLNINTKIAENEIISMLNNNKSFKKTLSDYKLQNLLDSELVKKIYNSLVSSQEYQLYLTLERGNKKAEKKILEYIFSDLILPNENFVNHLEENFINWDDDGDLVIALVAAFFQKPATFNFAEILSAEKWEFAKDLLISVIEKKDHCLELIKPKLKNWDAERIAALDMILMQMGVCEFLYFETIPPKVTINEYIDLAKDYSTQQSGNFVNGILDNIHKELLTENKIHKKNFKNSTL
jgi:N utilization substance protein B